MSKTLWTPSPFFRSRGTYPLDMIVIHHIGSKDGKLYKVSGAIAWFTKIALHRNPDTNKIENKVSSHYIIPRAPHKKHDIVHLVQDASYVAYHAGVSSWTVNGKLRKNINNYSVGIELEGDGNLVEYTDHQYKHLISLIKELMAEYGISEENIVGHEDISPGRKVDPGKLFDWKRLREGINPPKVITMPAVNIKGDAPVVEDEQFYMESGEETKTGFWTTLINLILKIFKR